MLRHKWWMFGLAGAVLALSPWLAHGQEGAKESTDETPRKVRSQPRQKPSLLRGEYGMLVKEAGLTDEQKAKLQGRVKTYNEIMSAWKDDNGEAYTKAMDAYRKARQSRDRQAIEKAREALKPLREGRDKLRTELWKDINAMLSDPQLQKWEGFKAYRNEMRRLRKLQLSDDQKKQIRKLCAAAGKDLAAAEDQKQTRAARNKLNEKVDQVLTDAQREELRKSARSRPSRTRTKPADRPRRDRAKPADKE